MGAATSSQAKKSMADIENFKLQVEESIAKSPGGLSSETLKAFTEGLTKVDQIVVEAIMSEKGNVLENVDLRDLVKEYFEASLETMLFLNELEHCLRALEDSHTHLRIAINKYETDKLDECLESLKKFEANGDPFQGIFFPVLDKLRKRQEALLAKVNEMHDENVRKRKKWLANLFSIVTVAAHVVTRVCLAITVAFPPTAAVSVAVAAASPLILSIVKARTEYERYKNREELTGKILLSTTCVREKLASIHIFADTLSKQIVSLEKNTHEAILDSDNIRLIMEPVKGRIEKFRNDISQLTVHARKCQEHIMNGRDNVAKLIEKFT